MYTRVLIADWKIIGFGLEPRALAPDMRYQKFHPKRLYLKNGAVAVAVLY